MTNNWVDFKVVKEKVSMQTVLDHYQINGLRKEREELVGRCPIHQGDGERAFHVSLSKNAFKCFSCKAHGNVLDFVAAMEKSSVREAALKLTKWFSISAADKEGKEKPRAEKKSPADKPASNAAAGESEWVNKPLSFQL